VPTDYQPLYPKKLSRNQLFPPLWKLPIEPFPIVKKHSKNVVLDDMTHKEATLKFS